MLWFADGHHNSVGFRRTTQQGSQTLKRIIGQQIKTGIQHGRALKEMKEGLFNAEKRLFKDYAGTRAPAYPKNNKRAGVAPGGL